MRKITIEQLNLLVKYLSSKPYLEVYQLLQMLSSLPEVKEKDDRQDTKKN